MESKRIQLVPYSREKGHSADVYEWINDAEVMYFFSGSYVPKSIETIQREYDDYINNDSRMIWIITAKTPHRPQNVGMVWLQRISEKNRSCELGIKIGKAHWGKKYGYESLELLADYVFNVLSFKRLYCSVLEYNKPAINLYKKLGLKYEGKYRAGAYVKGRYVDMYLYSILRHEWVKKKKRWIPWKDKKSEE